MKALLVCPLLSKIRQNSPIENKQSFTSCKFNNYIINKQNLSNDCFFVEGKRVKTIDV